MIVKRLKAITIGLAIVVIVIVIVGMLNNAESMYVRKGIVQESNQERVLVADSCGYVWEYEPESSTEGVEVGDEVELKMSDQQTSGYVFDDVIIDVEVID